MFARPISASLRPCNTTSLKKILQRWRTVGNLCPIRRTQYLNLRAPAPETNALPLDQLTGYIRLCQGCPMPKVRSANSLRNLGYFGVILRKNKPPTKTFRYFLPFFIENTGKYKLNIYFWQRLSFLGLHPNFREE